MPVPPLRPPPLRGCVFRGTRVIAHGLLTPDQLRSSAWRRLRRDVYADATLPLTHHLRARGVRLAAPPSAVFGGPTAAVLWAGEHFAEDEDPVEVVLPPGIRWAPGEGVLVRTASLDGDVVRPARGLPRTSPLRTAVDLARRGPLDEGVVLLDRLIDARLTTLPEVREAVAALPRCRGGRMAREVAALADGRAESPQETRLRLLLRAAGLPAPVAQFRVVDDAGFVARVDFAYPELRIAVEYDGVWHAEGGQFRRDRRRLSRLAAAGWRVIYVTAADLHAPQELVRRLRAVLAG